MRLAWRWRSSAPGARPNRATTYASSGTAKDPSVAPRDVWPNVGIAMLRQQPQKGHAAPAALSGRGVGEGVAELVEEADEQAAFIGEDDCLSDQFLLEGDDLALAGEQRVV